MPGDSFAPSGLVLLRKDWKASQAREAVKVPLAGAAHAEGRAQQASERRAV